MPYSASALGVLPPLWSRAAKKPRPVPTFSDWVVFTLPYSGTQPYRPAPGGMTAAMSGAVATAPHARGRAGRGVYEGISGHAGVCRCGGADLARVPSGVGRPGWLAGLMLRLAGCRWRRAQGPPAEPSAA